MSKQSNRKQVFSARWAKIEMLEDRSVPAILDWIGDVAGDANWNANAAGNTNWSSDLLPQDGDTLRFQSSTAVGNFISNNNIAGLDVANLVINRDSLASNNFVLTGNSIQLGSGGITANIGGNTSSIQLGITLMASSTISNSNAGGTLLLGGNLILNGQTATFDTGGLIHVANSGSISGSGAVVKNGVEELRISAPNAYFGTTTINAGFVSVFNSSGLGTIGAGNQTIVNDAILILGDGGDTFTESITLNNNGVLQAGLGSNSLIAPITQGGDAILRNINSGTSLSINGAWNNAGFVATLDLGTNANIDYSGILSGSGYIVKIGGGTFSFVGASSNTYTGGTQILDGTLVANRTVGQTSIPGSSVLIGDGVGPTGSALLRVLQANNIANTVDAIVSSDGRLDLVSVSDTIGKLTLQSSGSAFTSTGTLTVTDITFNGTNANETYTLSGTKAAASITYSNGLATVSTTKISYSGALKVFAFGGTDTINASSFNPGAGTSAFDVGAGDNTLVGSQGNDVIVGSTTGNDRLDGYFGNDTIWGFGGNDTILGNTGNDVLDAGTGTNVVLGGLDNDSILGGTGNDELRGNEGNDTLFGSDGNDVIEGGLGVDSVAGGNGFDIVVSNAAGNVTINNVLIDYAGVANDDSIATFERAFLQTGIGAEVINALAYSGETVIESGDGDDTVFGSNQRDVVTAGLGNDRVFTYGGNDFLNGNEGNDLLDGGIGNDRLEGNDGNDTAVGGDGDDYVLLGNGDDVADVGAGNDLVAGGIGNDKIIGGIGNDTLLGEDGNDLVQGDDGNDLLTGDAGTDTLLGNAGNDTLDGGLGADIGNGGTGVNVVVNIP